MQPQSNLPSKEQLEAEKLQLEIDSMRKHPLKKRDAWNLFITGFIGLASLFLLIKNGAFDFQSKELSYRRENLEWDIRKLQDEKDSVEKAINNFKVDSARLMVQNDSLTKSNTALLSEKRELDRVIAVLQKDRKYQESEFAKMFSQKNKELDSIRILADQNRRNWQNSQLELANFQYRIGEGLQRNLRMQGEDLRIANEKLSKCQKDLSNVENERDIYKSKSESLEKTVEELRKKIGS
jgi:chromosome segregation ATPase